MKRKLFCVLLSFALLISALIVPTGAVIDLESESVSWSDSSCLKLRAPGYKDHPIYMSFGKEISTNSTVTFYYMPDSANAGVANYFNFSLVKGYYDVTNGGQSDNLLTGIGWDIYSGGTAMNVNQYDNGSSDWQNSKYRALTDTWSRIDMLVDFDNKTMTAYLNYEIVGTAAFKNDLDCYSAILLPFRLNTAFYCRIDNLMITDGCNVPARGDIASNLSAEALKSNRTSVLYFDTFDDASVISNNKSVIGTAGTVYCARQGYQGYLLEIDTDNGMAMQRSGSMFRGCQESAAVDGKFNVRLVSTIDSLDYAKVGYRISVNGKAAVDIDCKCVYNKLLGSDDNGIAIEYTALGSFGANYIYALTVKGISETGTISLGVVPYAVDAQGKTILGTAYTVTYTDGAATITAD